MSQVQFAKEAAIRTCRVHVPWANSAVGPPHRMLQEDLASGRTAAEAAKEADTRREANRRRREAEAAAEVKSPVLVRRGNLSTGALERHWCITMRLQQALG